MTENLFGSGHLFKYETDLYLKGYRSIAGVDEAGRGPLAGPVVAAAVIFKQGVVIEGVNDSKKISPKTTAVIPFLMNFCSVFSINESYSTLVILLLI